MHTLAIPEVGIHTTYPSTIHELSATQYLAYLRLAYQLQADAITYTDFRLLLTYELIDMKRNPNFRHNATTGTAMRTNLHMISETLDSFLEHHGEKPNLPMGSARNLLPTFHTLANTWYGPSDALTDISWKEYITAITHLHAYQADPQPIHLHRLAAVLYYPVARFRPKPRTRPPYRHHDIEVRARKLSKVDPYILHGIFHYFTASIDYLTSQDITVLGNTINLKPLFTSSGADTSAERGAGLVDVLFTLAQTGVFGTVEQVEKQNLYQVLLLLFKMDRETKQARKNAPATAAQ
jgi:hypothetical protein